MREVGGENTPSAIIAASSKTIDLQYCRNIYQANIINGKVDICNLLHIDDGLYLLGKAVVSKIDEFCISYKFATHSTVSLLNSTGSLLTSTDSLLTLY